MNECGISFSSNDLRKNHRKIARLQREVRPNVAGRKKEMDGREGIALHELALPVGRGGWPSPPGLDVASF